MGQQRRRRRRDRGFWSSEVGGMPVWGIASALLVLLGIGGIALAATAQQGQASASQPTYTSKYTPAPMPSETPLPPVPIAAGTRTVIMGDSWTAGYGATDPNTEGYAVLVGSDLGLDYTLDYVSGTGYTNAGTSGQESYLQRLQRAAVDPAVQLLIIQGSGNDAGQQQPALREQITATVMQSRVTYPNASIVLIGPAPLRFPLKGDVPAMDSSLANVAFYQRARYISPYLDNWFTPDNAEQMIDPDKMLHPYTVGHRYFADQVIEKLRSFAG